MGVWQVIMIIYMVINVFCGFILDGKPRSGKYSGLDILATMVILAFVLYMGGFFR